MKMKIKFKEDAKKNASIKKLASNTNHKGAAKQRCATFRSTQKQK